MYVVYRAIGGICLNGKEYILDDDDEIRRFDTKEEILELVGVDDEEDLEEIGASIGTYEEEFPEPKD